MPGPGIKNESVPSKMQETPTRFHTLSLLKKLLDEQLEKSTPKEKLVAKITKLATVMCVCLPLRRKHLSIKSVEPIVAISRRTCG